MVFLLYNEAMYESPSYTIIKKEKPFELRQYQDFFTVTVKENSLKGYSGFTSLFNYISGNNNSQSKMKMTIPVINDLDPKEPTMEFVIPSLHVNQIPQPKESAMDIKHYPAHMVLVYVTSGNINQHRLDEIVSELQTYIQTHHLVKQGYEKIARYNGPFTLPFLRHNEVWVPVKFSDNSDKHHTT